MTRTCRRIAAVAAACAAVIAPAATAQIAAPTKNDATPGKRDAMPSCTLISVADGVVRTVRDGRTFVMIDGREVRLEGVEVPPQDIEADDGGRAGHAARDALINLLGTGHVVLRAKTAIQDRYGRIIAQPFVMRDEREYSITKELVLQGHALVTPATGEASCRSDLFVAEAQARRLNLGLWGEPYYGVRDADVPETIASGQFNIVRGRVASVRESGGTIYVNFGRRWSEDFTVTIAKRNERFFVAAGVAPKTLEGRTIEVRGYAEERGGPWIEAGGPEQIAVVADR